MIKYPTKEEILEKEVLFKKDTIASTIEWKKRFFEKGKWKDANKNEAIKLLLSSYADIYAMPVHVDIKNIDPMYDPTTLTIYLNKEKPSILSAMHEFAHHLYGSSELTACRWSVWLFKKTFPKTYESLVWDNHMLRKP